MVPGATQQITVLQIGLCGRAETVGKANIPILCVLALKNGCCFLGDVIRPDSLSESTSVVARQSQTLTAGLWVHQTSLTHRSAWSENSPMQG